MEYVFTESVDKVACLIYQRNISVKDECTLSIITREMKRWEK